MDYLLISMRMRLAIRTIKLLKELENQSLQVTHIYDQLPITDTPGRLILNQAMPKGKCGHRYERCAC